MKRLGHLATVIALTAGGVVAAAAPAEAAYYGCFDERVLTSYYKVTCDLSWPTSIQARVYCSHVVTGATTMSSGPEVGPGWGQRKYYTAYAYCPSGYEADYGGWTVY
ncbi:hypothetical protein [Longispora albida]|uniref:hypothetical protein n=1 Tax=Longispora albida TaxID=203523 RepID=UPI00035ECF31|nr:hypothetical protein [Longispora albida]